MIHCDILLQNTTATLLKNVTEVHYKIRQVCYYKMRVLLQNATATGNDDNVITKPDIYYKMRRLLQIATVH